MTVTGTRPEFIQTSLVTRAIRLRHREILVNTGQHYDDLMSRVFFRELDIPEPDANLNAGVDGASQSTQTGQIMMALEPLMIREQPDWVLVYGDTNSTVAAVLVAAKLYLPVAHIEAGLRSFDRRMPEEINRIVADHVSTLLLAPTDTAVRNLAREGITDGVRNVGDVRMDILARFVPQARPRRSHLTKTAGIAPDQPFALGTIHRASNTDDPNRLASVLQALETVSLPIILPVHPRLQERVVRFGLRFGPNVRPLPPLGFLDLLAMLDACSVAITDSGGLQKEAYMLRRPCVTMRDTTEWVETISVGWNRLTEPDDLAASVKAALDTTPADHPDLYGTSGVSERIVQALEEWMDAHAPASFPSMRG